MAILFRRPFAKQRRNRHLCVYRHNLRGPGGNSGQPGLKGGKLRWRNKVGFGDHNHIGHRHLRHAFKPMVQRRSPVGGIADRDHPVHPQGRAQTGRNDQRVQDRAGVSQTRCFYNDPVKGQHACRPPCDQTFQRLHQIAAHRAAQAARRQQHQFLGRRHDQVVVKPDIAKFIDDHRNPTRRGIAQQRVQQRGFPGTKIAGDQRQGDAVLHGVARYVLCYTISYRTNQRLQGAR